MASNERLRNLLREAGWSYDRLATAVRKVGAESGVELHTNKSAVAHWISGTTPAVETGHMIAEALSRRLGRVIPVDQLGMGSPIWDEHGLGLDLNADPVRTLRQLGEADIQRRRFLTGAAYSVAAAALPLGQAAEIAGRGASVRSTGRAGPGDIQAVRDMTTMFTAVDERHGGQHGRSAVVQYLTTDVAALCRARFGSTREHHEMLSAGACVAYLAGWKAYDAGEHGLAQRYYLQALSLTREAEDPLHAAFILRIMAHNGMDIQRPEHTLDLADAAFSSVQGRVDPATEAMFLVTRARALANANRPKDAVKEASGAGHLVEDADEQQMPYWAARIGSARANIDSHAAKTLSRIGDYRAAERSYARSARERAATQYPRITALTIASEARMQFRQGHVEQACGTWHRALDHMEGVQSARAMDTVKGVRNCLAQPRIRGLGVVTELRARLEALTTGR